jgi:transposase
VVEVAHYWFNRFRKLLVRYEKFTETYEAHLQMAAAIIAFRKADVIYMGTKYFNFISYG